MNTKGVIHMSNYAEVLLDEIASGDLIEIEIAEDLHVRAKVVGCNLDAGTLDVHPLLSDPPVLESKVSTIWLGMEGLKIRKAADQRC
jgi:hypothetical protein